MASFSSGREACGEKGAARDERSVVFSLLFLLHRVCGGDDRSAHTFIAWSAGFWVRFYGQDGLD
jgi:hypothetical protein